MRSAVLAPGEGSAGSARPAGVPPGGLGRCPRRTEEEERCAAAYERGVP